MDCLIDYIGLAGCGTNSPASGLYVNSLPGISLKSVEQLADAEQGTYIGVWNDVKLRASKRFALLLNNEFSKEYKLNSTKFTVKTKNENSDISSVSTIIRPAILLESNCVSELNSHHIKSIFVNKSTFNSATSIKFTFYNYETDEKLYENNYAFSNGLNEIVVDKKFYCNKLLIEFDSTNSNVYYDKLVTEKIYHDCVQISFGTYAIGKYTNTNKNYGISILYSNKCDWNNIVCYNKEVFALPFWYLLGSEMMMERMTSDRINKYTVDKKQAEELKAYYDTEFEKYLKQSISGISLDSCDCCLDCDPLIAIREALP